MEVYYQNRRELIVDIYLGNPNGSFAEIGRVTGANRTTVRNVNLKFCETKTTCRKPGSGCKARFQDPNKVKSVVSAFRRNANLAVRDVVNKFSISVGLVHKIKVKKASDHSRWSPFQIVMISESTV